MYNNEIEKETQKFLGHISLETKDETLIILKGHLLLEDMMREYCASKVRNEKPLQEAQLGFNHILGLSKAFNDSQINEWVWRGLKKVNRLRNNLAHNLQPKDYELKRDEFIKYVKESSKAQYLSLEQSEKYQLVATSLFVLYCHLSTAIKFKPKHLMLADALREHF